MKKNPTEENKYRRLKKTAKGADARAMKEEAERKINELGRYRNNFLRLVRQMKMESTDVVGGRCMRENNGQLYLNEEDSQGLNEENEWDQIVVMRGEIMEAFKYLTIGKAPGPTDVYAEMILASGDVRIIVRMLLWQKILDEKEMPAD